MVGTIYHEGGGGVSSPKLDGVSIYGEPVVNLDSDDEQAPSVSKPILVGRIIIHTRRFFVKVAGEVLVHAWNITSSLDVLEVRVNTFLYTFDCESEKQRALDGAPWNLSRLHLCLKEWSPDVVFNSISFNFLDFWVQMRGLPPHYMRLSKAKRVGTLFMEVLEVNLPSDDSILWVEMFLIRVRVDVNKPLPTGFITKDRMEDAAIRISFQCEDLGDYCYYCGMIGHLEKDYELCMADLKAGRRCQNLGVYGPELRATKSFGRRGASSYRFKVEVKGCTGGKSDPKVRDGRAAARVLHQSCADTGLDAEQVRMQTTCPTAPLHSDKTAVVPPVSGEGQMGGSARGKEIAYAAALSGADVVVDSGSQAGLNAKGKGIFDFQSVKHGTGTGVAKGPSGRALTPRKHQAHVNTSFPKRAKQDASTKPLWTVPSAHILEGVGSGNVPIVGPVPCVGQRDLLGTENARAEEVTVMRSPVDSKEETGRPILKFEDGSLHELPLGVSAHVAGSVESPSSIPKTNSVDFPNAGGGSASLCIADVGIFGYSRKNLTDEDLRSIIASTLTCRIDHQQNCDEKLEAFLSRTYYVNGCFDNREGMSKLNAIIEQIEGQVTCVEIRIQFRHVPRNLYRERIGHNLNLATNELILRDVPDEAILVKINNKVPGLGLQLDASELNLLYKERYNSADVPDSYEHLLLDVVDGDNHLFLRSDELAGCMEYSVTGS
ncbi:hypothetical protein Tsubulata_010211 [Turnera subulata]|uniref:DUF4283 domain-containing protein n=1 Tax=Turnera subulata TaxID=218843 RepID=A0A9Q0JN54_9ROSI|nr:hypothetical protein Tsubulata_010211 [Turnera subulata]